MRTEDHPLAYGDFEGTIPKKQYGGGTVMLWDTGWWEPDNDPDEGLKEGKLKFHLHGQRMHGGWALVRMKPRDGEKRENWLLIKEETTRTPNPTAKACSRKTLTSVKTGRSHGRDRVGQGKRRPMSGNPGRVPPTTSRQAPSPRRKPQRRSATMQQAKQPPLS